MYSLLLVVALAPVHAFTSSAHTWTLRPDADDLQATHLDGQQPSASGAWLGWGAGIFNNRWATSSARVDSSNVGSLQKVCTEDYPVGLSAAPLVVEGIAYYPTWSGMLVALEYTSCKMLWQTNVTEIIMKYQVVDAVIFQFTRAVSRTTPVMDREVLFFGTQVHALLLAIDKTDGHLVDLTQISAHPVAIITQSPTAWQDSIFVGSSSTEESAVDFIPGYICCSFRATMKAFSFKDSHFVLLWSQNMIPPGLNYSGAAIWGAQPAIDPVRNQVFIATGNVYSVPPEYEACRNQTTNTTFTRRSNTTDPCAPADVYQESVVALDFYNGQINWARHLTPVDAWNTACTSIPGFPKNNPGDCPLSPGPDADFGMAPTFVPRSNFTPYGEDTLIVGQKNGNLYALSAQAGTVYWATATSPDGTGGGLIWGLAVDASTVYYTAVNSMRKPWQLLDGTKVDNSAFGAASLTDGAKIWEAPVPRNGSSLVPPTVVNDVVMVGTSGSSSTDGGFPVEPGSLLSLDKHTGAILEEWILDDYFHGGIAVVDDYVMFGTGYQGSTVPNGSFNAWKLST